MSATPRPSDTQTTYTIPESVTRWLRVVPLMVVFLSGVNLLLIQWVLVRELTTLLFGAELVILLVTVSYFAGLSVGYGVSHRVKRGWLVPMGVTMLVLHLTLPIWFRLLVTALDALGVYGLAFILLPVSVPFIVSAFYSIFLPLYVDYGEGDLPTLYLVELTGSAIGVGVLVVLGVVELQAVYVIYGIGLVLMLTLLNLKRHILGLVAVAVVAWLLVFPQINRWSNSLFYVQLYDLPTGTSTLYTGYSAHQKIDLLETPEGARVLFLDGLAHFGSQDNRWLNVVMGEIPGALMLPDEVLVLGAGAMQLERELANFADHVTTVEIDSVVVDVSLEYLTDYNSMDTLDNRTIIIDDAKHFIANDEATYDLIATDLPAAFTLQTAALYSQAFFEQVNARLDRNGVFSVNLTSSFSPDDTVSRRIVSGLLTQFNEVMVITSEAAGWSFAYAGDNLPFQRRDVEIALNASGEEGYAIFETQAARVIVGDAQPITLDSLDVVLTLSADMIANRMGG